MALSVNDLATSMKSATQNLTDAGSAMSALGNSIANYIKANASFLFSWTATNTVTPFNPDPVVVANGGFISLVITLTPSNADRHDSAISYLENEITLGVKAAQYNITDVGFSTSPAIASDVSNISINIGNVDNRDDAFSNLANNIITWLQSYVPVATCIGSHGTYNGTGMVTNIS